MNLYTKEIQDYLEQMTTPRSQVMDELDRRTYVEMLMPQMISGHVQGQFLTMMVQMTGAKSILEIGSFTGYSAICLAKGLSSEGAIHTIEKNEEFKFIAQDFWEKAGVSNLIHPHFGLAQDIIPTLNEKWDLVFLDAAKKEYKNFYNLVFPQLKIGAVILADNVFWSGKVVWEKNDPIAKALNEFNEYVNNDKRVENVMLPLRDGLSIIRKVSE